MPTTASPVIVWFRKDLRLSDNLALLAAVEHGGPVIPVYVREKSCGPLGGAQGWWLHHSLACLSAALEKIGGRLVLASGDAGETLRQLISETGADAVFWNRRYDPAGMATDKALKQKLRDDGLTVRSFSGHLLHEPSRLQTKSGGPYRVYTPFWRAL
jgi:deoxyribodipyrimidine photo-lyase